MTQNSMSKYLKNSSKKLIIRLGIIGGCSKTTTSSVQVTVPENFLRKVIDWPSNSPDLNSIEILWVIVKRNTELRMPINLAELQQFMMEEWM